MLITILLITVMLLTMYKKTALLILKNNLCNNYIEITGDYSHY